MTPTPDIVTASRQLADILRAHYGDALTTVGVADDVIIVYWRPGTRTEIESVFKGYSVRERCMSPANPASNG